MLIQSFADVHLVLLLQDIHHADCRLRDIQQLLADHIHDLVLAVAYDMLAAKPAEFADRLS